MRNRSIFACLLVALGLRLAFIFLGFPYVQPRMHLRDDGDGYLKIAQTIRDGRYDDVMIGPVYPVFVAVCGSSTAVKVAQAFVDAGTCLLIWWLARLLAVRGGMLAAWLWAVYPFAIWRVAFINKETILTFLLLAYLAIQVAALRRQKLSLWLAAGILLGMVNLCKPTYILWPVILLVLMWRRRDCLCAVLLFMTACLVIIPWSIRNVRLTGEPILVATQNGGMTVFVGNYQPTAGMWESPQRYRWEAEVERIRVKTANASLLEKERAFYRAAWEQVKSNPLKAAELYVRKLGRFWFFSSARREPIASILIQAAYLALALLGLWRLWPLSFEQRLLPALVLFSMAFHAIGVAELRFCLPVMPAVCVFAAAAFRKTSATAPAAAATS